LISKSKTGNDGYIEANMAVSNSSASLSTVVTISSS